MVLERRQIANVGPATVNEIYDSLVAGGYNFQTKNDDYAKRNLYTTLTKNSSVFHRLPNGLWGLLEWYPDAKTAKTPKPSNGAKGETADVAASAEDDETPFNTDEAAEAALSEADARPAGKVVAKK
jgi:DNA-directed RNA polymerase delta subunit